MKGQKTSEKYNDLMLHVLTIFEDVRSPGLHLNMYKTILSTVPKVELQHDVVILNTPNETNSLFSLSLHKDLYYCITVLMCHWKSSTDILKVFFLLRVNETPRMYGAEVYYHCLKVT